METRADRDDLTAVVQQLTDKVAGLEEALLSRDVIGQAKGILMERLHLTSDQAFEELRTVSQRQNRKVRDISIALAESGEWPPVLSMVSANGNGSSSNGTEAHRP